MTSLSIAPCDGLGMVEGVWLTISCVVVYRQAAVDELNEKKLDFLPFPELEKAVVEDVEFLRASKLVAESVVISGWVYEVETGKTRRVV